MPREIIYSGSFAQVGGVWELHTQDEKNNKFMHLVPKEALHWRAGEYGLDPTDVDALMEILLHEPYMATIEDERIIPELKAKARPHLFEADNTSEARTHHLARVKECRVQIKVRGSKGLDHIRKNHTPDHQFVKEIQQAVDVHRWTNKYGSLPLPSTQHIQVIGESFETTGMKLKLADSSPDSMTNDSSLTIKVAK